jgi:hypothetical protein
MRTLAFLLTLWASSVGASMQTEFTLYRNAQVPLQGYPSGAWHWPGVAMSASMSLLYSNRDLSIESCRWAFSWTPDSGPSPTGIRLVAVVDGYVTPLVEVTMPNRATPTSDGRNVTAQIEWLLSLHQSAWLGIQTVGDGVRGPKIYHSVIECVWHE